MEKLLVLDSFLYIFKLLQNLDSQLVAKMVPLLLESPELLDFRKVLLKFIIGLKFSDLNAIPLLLHLRGRQIGPKEKPKEARRLSNQVCRIFILLIYTKLSLLLYANNEHVQVFQGVNGMLNVLFSGI